MLHLALAALFAIDPAKSTVTFSVQHIFVERGERQRARA